MDLASLLRSTNYFRRSPARIGGRRGHKEWLHFCVREGRLDVLVNFGVNDDHDRVGQDATERGQLILLVRDGNRWYGNVERYWDSDIDVAGGEIYARLGRSTLAFTRDGAFQISAQLPSDDVAVQLSLRPATVPSLANNIAVAAGQSLSWLVVPRLHADGSVRAGDKSWQLRSALTYHDHNWGHFAWGGDFAWEWGFGAPSNPDCPWSFMFVRLSDRVMACTKTQVLTIWRGAELVRSFRGRQLRVVAHGSLSPPDVFCVPAVMTLLAPGRATEVPAKLTLEAEAEEDFFSVELQPRHVAQIIVPNDGAAGVTRINEVAAELRARGSIGGERLDYTGGGVFEVVTP